MNLDENLKVKIPIHGKGPFAFKLRKDDESIPQSDCKIRVNENDGTVVFVLPSN